MPKRFKRISKRTCFKHPKPTPELSYHSYIKSFQETPDPSNPLFVRIILLMGFPSKTNGPKRKLPKIMAVLDGMLFLSASLKQKKNHEENKRWKKKDKAENEQFIAKVEAKYREDSKKIEKRKSQG